MDVTHLDSDRRGFGAYFYKIIRLYFHVVINAYVYKDIKVYLYVNTRMCLYVNMRTHQYAHTLTHKHIHVHMCSMHLRRDTFLRVPKMKVSEFGRLCLTNEHLAFGT